MGFFYSLLLSGTKPANDLERALLSFLKEKAPIEDFLAALKASRVHVLIKGEGESPPGQIVPLVIEGAGGGPAVCIFTSPERSVAMARRADGFGQRLDIEFRGFLDMIPQGFGIIVNAGTVFSTEAPPAAVDELR